MCEVSAESEAATKHQESMKRLHSSSLEMHAGLVSSCSTEMHMVSEFVGV